MINYVPERIYNKIKDDATYKEVVAAIEDKKAECTTFEQYIKSDSDEFYGDKATEYKAKLEEVIGKYCSEYLLEYRVNNGAYTNEQLLTMYNSEMYDNEYNFFFLSKIVASYKDNEYIKYMDLFVKDYEKLPESELSLLSGYIHLKYMYSKIYLTAFNRTSFEDKFQNELFNSAHYIYEKTLIYTDADIANNYVLEAMADSLQMIASKVEDHTKLFPYLQLIINFAEGLEYQYKNYSYGYAKILDMRNMLHAYARDYTGFLNGTIILCKYLSTALAVPSKLFKGLNYYDKCNHSMFVVLVRKYIKLKASVPILRVSDSAFINNLSPQDYDFALSNIIDIDTPSAEHDSAVQQYIISVDKWFNSDNMVFSELKDIKI